MALDKAFQKREPLVSDETRHRRKHSQTSKSAKRADHKHQYQKVIVAGLIGWAWDQRCSICGRFRDGCLLYSDDFCCPERRSKFGLDRNSFYSLEELRSLYPGIPVYKQDKNQEWYLVQE